jgi:hypothetical protein
MRGQTGLHQFFLFRHFINLKCSDFEIEKESLSLPVFDRLFLPMDSSASQMAVPDLSVGIMPKGEDGFFMKMDSVAGKVTVFSMGCKRIITMEHEPESGFRRS